MIRAVVQLIDKGVKMSFEGEKQWHSSDELQDALAEFHKTYASCPEHLINEAKKKHTEITERIREDLRAEGVIEKLEYTGSTYEGIKVPSTEMEFDVMVILTGGKNITAEETRQPLYAKLSTTSRTGPLAKIVDPDTDLLMPQNAAQYFRGKLQRTINKYPDMKANIILVDHGPAVQMDVYRENQVDYRGKRVKFYSVDMVPSFFIPSSFGGDFYVAKGFKEVDDGKTPNELAQEACIVRKTWRKSFSLDEKARIKNIDGGDKCRKQCMRVLKVLRDREATLKPLNSYIIKTTVLSLDREYPSLHWNMHTCLGSRFINVLQYLAKALDENDLPHFYVPEFNLLEDFSQDHRDNMRDRLKELIRSEQKFLKALKKKQDVSMSSSMYEVRAYRQPVMYESESSSDEEHQGAYSYPGSANSGFSMKETGLVLGGLALAGALYVGASLLGGDKDKKDKNKK